MNRQPVAYLTRVEKFSASHRLHSVHLSDEENRALFGPCNNPNGHGHNYTVEVTIKGPVNAQTGMVMNMTDLKKIIHDNVMVTMDHKNLDLDNAYFRDNKITSTVENISIVIFEDIQKCLPEGLKVHEIKLYETDKNISTFRGEYTS